MQVILQYIKENKGFILFLFLYSTVLMLKNKIGYANSWEDFVFHPDAPFWVFLNGLFVFLLIHIIKRLAENKNIKGFFSSRRYLKFFGLGFLCYLLLKNTVFILLTSFTTIEVININSSYQLTYELFSQTLDFVIFGGFSLGYLYYRENSGYRKKLNVYELSLSRSKIQQLKSQLNPHFLFNNLNILDQLITEDQAKASDFLHRFSELYRYALNSSDKDVIALQEELTFTQNYFDLMEEKYRGYYHLIISDEIREVELIVPPFCLQVLVENAIRHNSGTLSSPVTIRILLDNGIKVKNNIEVLSRAKKGNGIALKNLSEQFQLLTNQPISIEKSAKYFEVTLPLIKTNARD